MKKVILALGVVVGLTSCEKDIIIEPTPTKTYTKLDALRLLPLNSDGELTFWGHFSTNPNVTKGTQVALTLLDSTQSVWNFKVEQLPTNNGVIFTPVNFSVTTSQVIEKLGIGTTVITDAGTHYYKTTVNLVYKNAMYSCNIEQRYIKKNGPNTMGENIVSTFNFQSI